PTKTVWFTGLSGAGKTTIANELKSRLEAGGKRVKIFDGDEVRARAHKQLGFSREDIRQSNHLIAELCRKSKGEYDFILVPVISPYREDRKMAREIIGDDSFIELFIATPLSECIRRDVKGLYKKALNNEIDNMIGFSEKNPYELPESPNFSVDTTNSTLQEVAARIISFLENQAVEQPLREPSLK
ncbi:MAG TPA: adenylyl-sulfate kinase, partial [Flavisolibacter sp.]